MPSVNCNVNCGCDEACPALETRAELERDDEGAYDWPAGTGQRMLDAADREARY